MDAYVAACDKLFDALVWKNPLGPKVIRIGTVVNIFKGGMPFIIAGLMRHYSCNSLTMKLYFVLHGSYGLFWLLKDFFFPDKSWDRKISPGGALVTAGALSLYAFPAYVVASQNVICSDNRLAVAVLLYVVGVVLMMGADAQKNTVLAVKKGLISDGFFKYLRNPNYLGEVMLYSSFNLLGFHWLSVANCLFMWLGFFVPNMVRKDQSLSRHPEFAEYKKRSNVMIPFIW